MRISKKYIIPLFLSSFFLFISQASAAGLGETCFIDNNCTSPYVCTNFRCANPTLPVSPGTPGASCDRATDCSGRQFCLNNICTRPEGNDSGESCQKADNCNANLNLACTNGKCTPPNSSTSNPTGPTGGNTGAPTGNQGTPAGNTGLPPGRDLTIQSIYGIILGLTCWLTRIALLMIIAFLMWYGFLFLKAQGDPSKVGDAKKAFGWGIVGVIVILGTYSIIATVAGTVGGGDVTLSPIPIDCSEF